MAKTATKSTAPPAAPKPTMGESIRETVDSIVIAFVLAFLFRTFEAEAFVIPTGSMALTLMGDHKDLDCVKCGYTYRVSASGESQDHVPANQADPGVTVISGECPNCRYRVFFDPAPNSRAIPPPEIPMPPSYKGDRILVTKYSYEFGDPDRWDVAVFKNPSQAKINYIKRIVGLPGEEILIYRGDVYTRSDAAAPFRMTRKPADKFLAVAQTVHDADYVVPEIYQHGWPQRWVSRDSDGEVGAWKQSDDLKSFHAEPPAGDEGWLRYQHFVPSEGDWILLKQRALDPSERTGLRPELISDYCEYNSNWDRRDALKRNYEYLGLHWVGDVGVECELTFGERKSDDAEAVLEIVEGGRVYQCRIRVDSGDAELSISGLDAYRPTAKGAVRGAGPHRLRFANVDDRLLFWVNDRLVEFDSSTNFQTVNVVPNWSDGNEVLLAVDGESKFPPLNNLVPTEQDVKSPIGIAVKDCTADVAHLRVLRDVYYIAFEPEDRYFHPQLRRGDYTNDAIDKFRTELKRQSIQAHGEDEIAAFLALVDVDPDRFKNTLSALFKLQPDQFFVMGDNSPRSLDSRLWKNDETFVARELLIGKALFVYWPHSLDRIPGTSIPFPFFPNFARMRMIR